MGAITGAAGMGAGTVAAAAAAVGTGDSTMTGGSTAATMVTSMGGGGGSCSTTSVCVSAWALTMAGAAIGDNNGNAASRATTAAVASLVEGNSGPWPSRTSKAPALAALANPESGAWSGPRDDRNAAEGNTGSDEDSPSAFRGASDAGSIADTSGINGATDTEAAKESAKLSEEAAKSSEALAETNVDGRIDVVDKEVGLGENMGLKVG